MQEGLNKMKERSNKKKRRSMKQKDSELPQIREDLFDFFDRKHKKFYENDKEMEFIDNAHLNLPELRQDMIQAEKLIAADDDDKLHKEFAVWTLLSHIVPRGDLFKG